MTFVTRCDEAARAMSAAQDRSLGLVERLSLGFHLKICAQCPQFLQQLEMMRTVMRRWRDADEHHEIEATAAVTEILDEKKPE